MDVIFSGIQPSGSLTLGNYLGALKNFIPFQEKAVIIGIDFHGKRRLSHEGFFYDDPYGQYYD